MNLEMPSPAEADHLRTILLIVLGVVILTIPMVMLIVLSKVMAQRKQNPPGKKSPATHPSSTGFQQDTGHSSSPLPGSGAGGDFILGSALGAAAVSPPEPLHPPGGHDHHHHATEPHRSAEGHHWLPDPGVSGSSMGDGGSSSSDGGGGGGFSSGGDSGSSSSSGGDSSSSGS